MSAQPSREHLQKLLDAGLSQDEIARQAGVSRSSTISELLDADKDRIRALTEARILRVPIPAVLEDRAKATYTPAIGSRRRIQGLIAIGYECQYLQARLGCSQPALSRLITGNRPRGQDRIMTSLAVRVDELFRELERKPGDSRRAILRGQRENFAPPLAWDEDSIDDPDAEPSTVRRDDAKGRGWWFDSYFELRQMGITDVSHIARRIGVQQTTVERQIDRWRKDGAPT